MLYRMHCPSCFSVALWNNRWSFTEPVWSVGLINAHKLQMLPMCDEEHVSSFLKLGFSSWLAKVICFSPLNSCLNASVFVPFLNDSLVWNWFCLILKFQNFYKQGSWCCAHLFPLVCLCPFFRQVTFFSCILI